MVARQRFQDTMVTLRSTIQAEYGEVRTNINERLGDAASITGCANDGTIVSGQSATGNSKCLAVGKLIQFKEGSQDITISYVVSNGGINNQYLNMSDEGALKDISAKGNLKLVGSSSSYTVRSSDAAIKPKTVRIEWGGEFAKGWTISDSPKQTNAIAILHSPISGAILVFTFSNTNPIGTDGNLDLSSGSANQPIAIMIKNAQAGFKGAAICIDSGASSSAVRMAIPADSFYNFDNTNPTYKPDNLKGLCNV
jgi:hypothetical protein